MGIKTFAAVAVSAVMLLTGCGSGAGKNGSTSRTAAEILDTVSSEGLCPALDTRAELGSEGFDNACPKLFGIESTELTDGGIMYTASGQTADEIAALKGDGDMTQILTEHAKTRAASFKGYAPDEQQKAENALVFDCGGLTVMVIADNAEQIRDRLCKTE